MTHHYTNYDRISAPSLSECADSSPLSEQREFIINLRIDGLNYHLGIQKMCEQLEHAGFKYLRSPSLHGMGLAAKIDMPEQGN
jgi:hypothetical protein